MIDFVVVESTPIKNLSEMCDLLLIKNLCLKAYETPHKHFNQLKQLLFIFDLISC